MESNSEWRAEEAIAGNNEALEALRELIIYPLHYSSHAQLLGLKWRRGLLLYGPPGTGKTSLVRAVVKECDARLTVISPHTVHRAHVGESEKVLREAFMEASSHAESGKPSVIFIDEIDALCPRRNSRREQDARLASQLLTLMDSNQVTSSVPPFVVVASTNRVDTIDPALRRSGRFDTEVEVSTPNEHERLQILLLYTRKLRLDPDVNLQALAASCNGYVGADLEALCRETVMSAVQRATQSSDDGLWCIIEDDWKVAKSIVGPSITRGVTVDIPKVSWDDIGGLNDLKKKLRRQLSGLLNILLHFQGWAYLPCEEFFFTGLLDVQKQPLLKLQPMQLKLPFSHLVARNYIQCMLERVRLCCGTHSGEQGLQHQAFCFLTRRMSLREGGGTASGNISVGERLLSTLLTEMDGLEQAKGIIVLAATNRPHAIDPALMRPGRFDLVLYVPPPDLEARHEILRVHTRKMKLGSDVDLNQVAEETEFFTGAELEGLCREAGIVALREDISATIVNDRHFQTVKSSLKPALTREEVDRYSRFMKSSSLQLHQVQLETELPTKTKPKGFGPVSAVTVGALSLVVVAAAKYFSCRSSISIFGAAAT